MRKVFGLATICIIVFVGVLVWQKQQNQQNSDNSNNIAESAEEAESQTQFDKTHLSLSGPSSLWVVVNKKRPLPDGYTPSDLKVPNVLLRLSRGNEQMRFSAKAEKDLISMFNAAKDIGINLVFGSGYRSENLQRQFYNSYVASDGQTAADQYSARPGYSEHQTGLAVDITSPSGKCHLEICWEDTAEGKWVRDNSYRYGFVVRYLKGKEQITGYQYEPWHLRYVGKDLAKQLKNQTTLEEFFDLPSAKAY